MSVPCRLRLLVLVSLIPVLGVVAQANDQPGKIPYDRECLVCHGPEGRGDIAPSLVPLVKDYGEVLGIVRDGSGEMPPILAQRVTDDEVRQIVEYLKSMDKGSASASASHSRASLVAGPLAGALGSRHCHW